MANLGTRTLRTHGPVLTIAVRCPVHTAYRGVRKPAYGFHRIDLCKCADVWNSCHRVPDKICVTPGCGSSVGIFRDNYLCPSCSND